MSAPRFDFYPRGFENTPHPCLVVEDPQGGDPRILALLSVIHRPTDLQGLVEMANAYLDSIDPPPTCPVCKGGVCEAPSECGGIEPLSIPQQFEPVSNADEFAPASASRLKALALAVLEARDREDRSAQHFAADTLSDEASPAAILALCEALRITRNALQRLDAHLSFGEPVTAAYPVSFSDPDGVNEAFAEALSALRATDDVDA